MVFKLQGRFQHYDWGGTTKLPSLFQLDNTKKEKYAEYWMGAHPLLPSFVENNHSETILDWIKNKSKGDNSTLPFLTKILDVHNMLSIQIHPAKQDAERGFAAEEKNNIPLTSAQRTYKDPNEKEEVLLTWSPFWMLYGFRQREDIIKHLQQYPFTQPLQDILQKEQTIKGVFEHYFALDKQVLEKIFLDFKDVLQKQVPFQQDKNLHEYWMLKAIQQFSSSSLDIQKDVMMILFHNLFQLQKGDAVFMKAGSPHAYLEGLGYEIITNSDNVIRSGLTTKKIDQKEFLRITDFTASQPIYPQKDIQQGLTKMTFPTQSFALDIIEKTQYENTSQHYELLFVLEGSGEVLSAETKNTYKQYDCFFVDAKTTYTLHHNTRSILYRIYTPKTFNRQD